MQTNFIKKTVKSTQLINTIQIFNYICNLLCIVISTINVYNLVTLMSEEIRPDAIVAPEGVEKSEAVSPAIEEAKTVVEETSAEAENVQEEIEEASQPAAEEASPAEKPAEPAEAPAEPAAVNYSECTLEELLGHLKTLLEDPLRMRRGRDAEGIRSSFYRILAQKKTEAGIVPPAATEGSEEPAPERNSETTGDFPATEENCSWRTYRDCTDPINRGRFNDFRCIKEP